MCVWNCFNKTMKSGVEFNKRNRERMSRKTTEMRVGRTARRLKQDKGNEKEQEGKEEALKEENEHFAGKPVIMAEY